MEQRFLDRVAIVTGAASGMGRATAVRFAAEGARVFGIDMNADGLAATAEAIGSAFTGHVADISKRESCQESVAACVEALGVPHVLANVAGVLCSAHVVDVTEADFSLLMGVNVGGTFWMCQATLPLMLEAGRGSVVNIASNAGLMGTAYTVAYSASKGAVVSMTRSLAMEFVRTPIRINCVAPGGVVTPMTDEVQLPEGVDYKLMAPYVGFRKMADPSELAAVIAFVASDEARQMHGSIVSADSGLTAG